MTIYRLPNTETVYKQANSQWAKDPYPTAKYTFAKNGCGACAVLHCIMERSKYRKYTPKKVRPYMVQFATPGHGTEWAGIPAALKHYGLKNVKEYATVSSFFTALKKGDRVGVILVTNKPGPDGSVWTKTGHYLCVCGYKEENGKHFFYIKDSGSRRTRGFYCYETSLKGCIRKIWVGQLPGDEIQLPSKGFWTLGDKSPEICKIQAFLKAQGVYNGKVAENVGKVGKLTYEAIKKWQKAKKLVPDGKWGPKTNAKYEEVINK